MNLVLDIFTLGQSEYVPTGYGTVLWYASTFQTEVKEAAHHCSHYQSK